MTHPPASPAALAIIICTFHREVMLAALLESLRAQVCPPGLSVEVVVVDNSDLGTARSVVEAAAAMSPFAMRWTEAHPANISVARNCGVAASAASHIAFIDDDQVLLPGWLDAVAVAIQTLPADIFFGRNLADFETPDQATTLTRALFSRNLQCPAGHRLHASGPEKTRDVALATSNAIFRRAALPPDSEPFDLAFGHGGGEDFDLICRIEARGGQLVWLPDAIARELVPAQRCTPQYMRRRMFAGGQAFARAMIKLSPTPDLTRWSILAKALVQSGVLMCTLPFTAFGQRDAFQDRISVLCGVVGKMVPGKILPIYKRDASDR